MTAPVVMAPEGPGWALGTRSSPTRFPATTSTSGWRCSAPSTPPPDPCWATPPSGRCAACFLTPVRFCDGGATHLYQPIFTRRVDGLLAELAPLAAAAALPPIPTRFLQGEWDRFVPGDTAKRLQAQIHGPSDIAWFPRRTHTTLLYDRDAAASSLAWYQQHL